MVTIRQLEKNCGSFDHAHSTFELTPNCICSDLFFKHFNFESRLSLALAKLLNFVAGLDRTIAQFTSQVTYLGSNLLLQLSKFNSRTEMPFVQLVHFKFDFNRAIAKLSCLSSKSAYLRFLFTN